MKSKKEKTKAIYFAILLPFFSLPLVHAEDNTPSRPSMAEIIAAPEVFDGKTVTTQGWVSMRSEDVNLWVTWQDHESRNHKQCISLANRFRDPAKRKEVDGKQVELTGVFKKDISKGPDGVVRVLLSGCSKMAIEFDTSKIQILN